ncbi:GAD-like domain-containing protein [Methylobacterium indicum]|uniref:GAD-like domain-containing protein n=2 Tax=Methylobacterium indicum TaxID=1775910 RepID=UPI002435513C|nr:GAD-like domain-containing protein [Methylobacterium indicum]
MVTEKYKSDFDELVADRNPSIVRNFSYEGENDIPEHLKYMWSKVGISSWEGGTFWTCDPAMVWGAIEDSLEEKKLLKASECVPYAISAFGSVFAWNEMLGVIRFEFQRGRIISFNNPDNLKKVILPSVFMTPFPFSKEKYDEYNLYDCATANFGPLSEGKIFSFAPSLPLGGAPSESSLILTDARVHLAFLAQSQVFQIFHFNSRLYPGGYKQIE